MNVVRLSGLCTGHLYTQETFLVLNITDAFTARKEPSELIKLKRELQVSSKINVQ
jgi:hypothetical protein